MVVAAFVLFHFMRTGRKITKKEAVMLVLFWLLFVAVEFMISK
jgi:Ca2+/Na+ antiporter